jgi:hypothetical protein
MQLQTAIIPQDWRSTLSSEVYTMNEAVALRSRHSRIWLGAGGQIHPSGCSVGSGVIGFASGRVLRAAED